MVPRRVVWVAAVGDGIVERSRSNKKRLTCLWWGTDSCCLRGVCSCHVHGLPMVPLSSSPLHDIGCGLNRVSCRCAFCVVHRAFPTCCSAMLSLCYGWSAGHEGAEISLNSQREIANLHLASILAAVCLPALGVFCVSLLGFCCVAPHVPHSLNPRLPCCSPFLQVPPSPWLTVFMHP